MKVYSLLIIGLMFLISCQRNSLKDLEIQGFSPVEVKTFKKKSVEIESKLHYLNVDKNSEKFMYAELDVYVNGKDVGTFISKNEENISANELFELPVRIEFLPEDAFLDLDYGMLKIKSDVVAPVQFKGFISVLKGEKTEKISFNETQTVLFTNNAKLFLDENGKIHEK